MGSLWSATWKNRRLADHVMEKNAPLCNALALDTSINWTSNQCVPLWKWAKMVLMMSHFLSRWPKVKITWRLLAAHGGPCQQKKRLAICKNVKLKRCDDQSLGPNGCEGSSSAVHLQPDLCLRHHLLVCDHWVPLKLTVHGLWCAEDWLSGVGWGWGSSQWVKAKNASAPIH